MVVLVSVRNLSESMLVKVATLLCIAVDTPHCGSVRDDGTDSIPQCERESVRQPIDLVVCHDERRS